MKQVKAHSNYQQRNNKELSLTKGKIYQVTQISNNGDWILGHLQDAPIEQVGWFPVSCVQETFEEDIRYYGKAKKYSKGGTMSWETLDEEIVMPSRLSYREKGTGIGEVRIHIIRAEHIYMKKLTAYVVRRHIGTGDATCICKTKRVKGETGRPVWNEEMEIQSYDPEMEVIEVSVSSEKIWKKAKGKSKRKCSFSLRSSSRDFDSPGSQLRWFELLDDSGYRLGRLLMNIQYISHSISSPLSLITTEERLQGGKIPRHWEKLSQTIFPCASESIIPLTDDFFVTPLIDVTLSGHIKITTVRTPDAIPIIREIKEKPLREVMRSSVDSVRRIDSKDRIKDVKLSGNIKIALRDSKSHSEAEENKFRVFLKSSMENSIQRMGSDDDLSVSKGLLPQIQEAIQQRKLYQILRRLEDQ
eukprot:TRINITY_DN2340_c0_g1_i1.p1 TRINITY_DN2340_c0_g1~~TRINITY_DN2340_c0_g1_i1.p1  ORF type:complete len:415 (-),score=75.12 TRINITY_DN2340_c0_g1_i1:21-1265(-)